MKIIVHWSSGERRGFTDLDKAWDYFVWLHEMDYRCWLEVLV